MKVRASPFPDHVEDVAGIYADSLVFGRVVDGIFADEFEGARIVRTVSGKRGDK